jgi:hypothetical protein
MSRKILIFSLFSLFFFLRNEVIFAREFPVESDISDTQVTPTLEIKKPTIPEKKTPIPTISIEQLTADWGEKSSYELFWPITAGKVPGDRFYNLKIWRDKLAGYFFFNPVKKSEYLKQLANKRLMESEKLVELNRWSFFQETLDKSIRYMKDGIEILYSTEPTSQTLWLEDEYAKDLRKHLIVLGRLKEKVRQDQLGLIEDSIKKINELADKYKIEI